MYKMSTFFGVVKAFKKNTFAQYLQGHIEQLFSIETHFGKFLRSSTEHCLMALHVSPLFAAHFGGPAPCSSSQTVPFGLLNNGNTF